MFGVQRVTLCLLITYHWHGSAGSRNVSVPVAGVRIAGEVNGSPTDARLNIPVVKRSSNQAGSANELRPVLVERARAIVEVVPTHFELPHEYANRNEEKYTKGIRESMGKLEVVKEPTDAKIFRHEREERDEKRAEEKGRAGRRIKSSIRAEDEPMLAEPGLIGKANYSPLGTSVRRRFDYDGASVSRIRRKRNDEGSSGLTAKKREYKKAIDAIELYSGGRAVVGSPFASYAPDYGRRGVSDGELVGKMNFGDEKYSSIRELGTNEERKRGETKLIQKRLKEDRDASGLSSLDRSSTSLKPTERLSPERSKPSVAAASASGEIGKVFHFNRLHQQSRNTKPRTIAQHLRRNIKRQTFDEATHDRNAAIYRNRNDRAPSRRIVPIDAREQGQYQGPQLRFIPATNDRRSRPVDDRIYLGDNARRTFNEQFFAGTGDNNDDASSFYPNGDTNPRAIEKFPRFDTAQIESLKGVFDKYDLGRQGKRNELPNVRMILPKQIFVAPPRLVYHTKILPAPFTVDPYFRSVSGNADENNHHSGNDDGENVLQGGFAISGVFDENLRNEQLNNRDVIPVMENPEPSLADPSNFVTPLPPYRLGEGGNGQVSMRLNRTSEDSAELDEMYRVSGGNIGIVGKTKEESQRDGADEAPRLNHESPIGVGAVHHSGFGGSSYDNSVSTFGSADESGSGNVDHSAVIEANTDEYVNHEPPSRGSHTPAVRTGTQSAAKSNDATYDRGGYKWRGKYDNDNERYAANYSFGYRVSDQETRNNFGHRETRKEGITEGKYHVKLPDGRIQEVNYHVDDRGYHARVSYRLAPAE